MTMPLPPYGICSHCKYEGLRDGDTPLVRVIWWPDVIAVREADAWCMEVKDKRLPIRAHALRAKQFTHEICSSEDDLNLFVAGAIFHRGLVNALSFDRLPALLYIGKERTLGDHLVASGYGWRTEKEQIEAEDLMMEAARGQ